MSATTIPSELDPNTQLRLAGYLEQIGELLGNKTRRGTFAQYALGLFGDASRKSAEPIAAALCSDPDDAQAMHFKLCNFLRRSPWQDAPIRQFATRYAVDAMQKRSPIRTWIVDDTGFLKKGDKSPGIHRQYTGSAGKVTNCQVAVSLTLASDSAHVPADFRLYLPKVWTEDRKRCREAWIPDTVEFAPKWKLALDMITSAVDAEMPPGVVCADSGYGDTGAFRDGVENLGLSFAVGVHRTTTVRRVRGSKRRRLDPVQSVEELAFNLPAKCFRKVTWRDGTKSKLSAKATAVRVQVEHGDGRAPTDQWLLIEWPDGEHLPSKFTLSNLLASTSLKRLFLVTKERWRVERSYQDLKGQLGLDHFEGRSFTGWHHHVTIVLCCYAFCVAEHARSFSPSASGAATARTLAVAA
ncbi:MAG: IS701 family transposase [Actinomycetales bacterium]|nr:IS701 family transposase [Actinomycetales bacterium]